MRCEPECTCKRHQNAQNFKGNSSNPCESGCTCKRHPAPKTSVGQRFERWTVIEIGLTKDWKKMAHVVCDCGKEGIVAETILTHGKSLSCGCLRQEKLLVAVTSHGLSDHPLYAKWHGMMGRCSASNPQFKDYAGRGITVCEQWKDPTVFIAEIESSIGLCPKGMSLDRIDNDGNYEPGNVRWATHSEQMLNRRKKRMKEVSSGR